jgi:S-adenosyl-L-methionine hydrolase (adenosine-forming)
MAPIITLTTDFGTRDSYVAAMKGVILGIARHARLVDVSHEVAPHDVTEAALALEAAAPFFPAGAVHLAVVDPGVGTARRGLAVAAGGVLCVGPDNGLFTPMFERRDWRAFELTAPEYRLRAVSRTFHGRDIFAPAAAHLALGLPPERLGPRVDDPVRLSWPTVREAHGAVAGTVLHIDRFGNLVTSIRAEAFESFGQVTVRFGGRALPFVGTYGELTPGQAGALVGGSGRLEIAVREGSAALRLRARRGAPVVVSRSSPVRRVRRRS